MTRPLIALFALCLAIAASVAVAQTVCDADIQRDGYIDGADLTVILGSWGPCAACVGDISGDHLVDGIDLAIVLARWGGSCVPTISTVNPNSGPAGGGTAITITGSGLQGTSSVLIGGMPATNVVVVNSTTVTAVTPPSTSGTKALVLASPSGTATAKSGFTYATWYSVLEQVPDPAVVPNETTRQAITATGMPWRVRDIGTGIEMLLVPPASFEMGCAQGSNSYACRDSELPLHTVTLTRAFYIGRYEVTQAQWEAKMGANPSHWQPPYAPASPNLPIEQVSWNMIAGAGGFLTGTGLRLPTEAEWEFSCRAGTTTPFHSGPGFPSGTTTDELLELIAWYECHSGCASHVVGTKAANALGLHDMLGNVWEWCSDWHESYSSAAVVDPSGPSAGLSRVLRGGSWNSGYGQSLVRSSFRALYAPDVANWEIGFRVARNP